MCEYTSMTIITEDVNMEKYVYDKNNGLWLKSVSAFANGIAAHWFSACLMMRNWSV